MNQLMKRLDIDYSEGGEMPVSGVATLEDAEPNQIVFAESERLMEQIQSTRAALILVSKEFPDVEGKRLLRVESPRLTFLRLSELFVEQPEYIGIHSDASVYPDAEIEDGVSIGPCAVISKGVSIGADTVIGPGVFIGDGVSIGSNCRIDSNSSILPGVVIGNRVVIRTNASIGGEGFGFVWLEDHHHPVPQLGRVEIEDDVEIGCNSCVDRATLGVTRIGRGSKIDNQVHVAHNCELGEDSILVAQVGLSGSVKVGAKAVLAGKVGVVDHINIGAGSVVGGRSTVTRDVEPNAKVWGTPARDMKRAMREQAAMKKLPDTLKQMKILLSELETLRNRIKELEDCNQIAATTS